MTVLLERDTAVALAFARGSKIPQFSARNAGGAGTGTSPAFRDMGARTTSSHHWGRSPYE
jgi:hypothetical protein